jgi:hypothetical protein
LKKSDTEDSVSSCICAKLCYCCAVAPPAVNDDIIIPTAINNALMVTTAIVILFIVSVSLFLSYLILS